MTWEEDLEGALTRFRDLGREFHFAPKADDIGHVLRVGDGVAFVDGLAGVELDELLIFGNGIEGQVLDVGRTEIGCILFGPEEGVMAGSTVFRTRTTPSIPAGDRVLGRVIDAVGNPRDGLGPLESSRLRPLDSSSPGPLDREPVREPLLTGIKVIDAAVPVGLGQRELILGDRGTGKSSIAIDTIINQRDSGVVCIYVSIGSRRAAVKEVVDELTTSGALANTVVVVADAAEPAPLRYLAAYAGCAIAESFAYEGRHALVVYDDLTRHAEAYRDLSLLLRRPPSREAYPRDIFYVQARLMERAFKLRRELGGGSITALPIRETQQGNISGFIPTNVISMTDGQIYLDATLFAEGQLPAIDIGRSVSRVGGGAQYHSLREAASNLRIELSQYAEVRGFTRFGAILDESTKQQLRRGDVLTQLLLQPERQPVPLALQVAIFWALKRDLIADLPPELVGAFESQLLALQGKFPGLDAALETADAMADSTRADLESWIAAATQQARTVAPP